MGSNKPDEEEMRPLTKQGHDLDTRLSTDSAASSNASLSLALLDRAKNNSSSHTASKATREGRKVRNEGQYRDEERGVDESDDDEVYDNGSGYMHTPAEGKPVDRRARIIFWILLLLCVGGWAVAFFVFLTSSAGSPTVETSGEGSNNDTANPLGETEPPPVDKNPGEKITLAEWTGGKWRSRSHEIEWIAGPDGEDGLLLEQNDGSTKGFLAVEDVRSRTGGDATNEPTVLMKRSTFTVEGNLVFPSKTNPSPDLRKVLVVSEQEPGWRHSYKGKYWLFDVESQKGEALDPDAPDAKIQLASWSPNSDAVAFTRDNNMFVRHLSSKTVKNVTEDGSADVFYGVPDWVYEEEVFHGNSATWWSRDGKYIAYLRTDETAVPEFPVQYFLSRPSGNSPPPEEDNYPDVVNIKYPKAGAPNPIVHIQFYDVEKGETFSIDIEDDFEDPDRLIIEVIWADNGKAIVRETNRVSDLLKLILVDAGSKSGKIVRSQNIQELDGGWVEPSQNTRFIPADPENGRPNDGYIDTIINDGYEHLGYFTPLNNSEPVILTSGNWEVVESPTAVDLKRDLVYFVATKEASWERHVYSVKLDGSSLQAITDTSAPGYYGMSFSDGAGYGLLSYQGPGVPWQKLISTPANDEKHEEDLEQNKALKKMVKQHAMPLLKYSNVTVDGFGLPVLERRPPDFDPKKKYPVLFQLYGGPNSQSVDKTFDVDFQSYVASSLGYLVVTVDGRGTGFNGRRSRCIIRDNIGHYEAIDQIETAKIWGKKSYVDESRMAIWGWSYGGYMTLKVLEQDAGRTFQYGMAVAPVTDWQFYDSIYTERYMHTPQDNAEGYTQSAITNTTALKGATRFMVAHGSSDDNVHIQNTLTLLDNLDVGHVSNYDVHVFPDSNHGIFFHDAYIVLHSRLSDWLVNAFNGEWAKIRDPVPDPSLLRRALGSVTALWNR